jgi:hypothetical protein
LPFGATAVYIACFTFLEMGIVVATIPQYKGLIAR